MSLSTDSSVRVVAGHVDLQEFPGAEVSKPKRRYGQGSEKVNGAHLNEIRQRLLADPAALNEAVIAWSVEIHGSFLSGTRGIARWTGTHKETVQDLAGPEGGISEHEFLYTATRGRSSVIPEEREDMVLRFNSLAGRSWSWESDGYRQFAAQSFSRTLIPSSPWSEMILRDGKVQRENGRETAGIGEQLLEDLVGAEEFVSRVKEWGATRSWSHDLLNVTDPADDLWAEDGKTYGGLGRHAWRLAVLFALQDIQVTSMDLQALTGLKERGVRDLLAKWKESPLGFVVEEKVGRTKVFSLLFRSTLHPDGNLYSGVSGNKTRMLRAQALDARERETAARRGTGPGWIAWKLSRKNLKRDQHLADMPLGPDPDPAWVALVEEGDELRMHEYLVEQEAGIHVPASPEALGAPVETEPAKEAAALHAQLPGFFPGLLAVFMEQSEEARQEALVEMRARITGRSASAHDVTSQAAEVADSGNLEETEDDRYLRINCGGQVGIFENIWGRRPNQECPAPTEQDLRRQRLRARSKEIKARVA